MVAALVLVLGAIAIFKIVDAATRTSYRAEQSQVVSNLLQRELERVKSRDVSQMAIDADACSSPMPPELQGRWDANGFDGHEWIIDEGDIEDPIVPCEPVTVADSDVTVDVYRMITWFDPDKPNCVRPGPNVDKKDACGMRRITVGAKPRVTGPGGERAYKEIQSDVVDLAGEV